MHLEPNKHKNILTIISVIFLFLAFFEGWPYGFFTLLRIVVCVTTAYSGWIAFKYEKEFWAWTYGIIAILFNPIIPLHLGRELWLLMDLFVAIFFIVSIFLFKIPFELN